MTEHTPAPWTIEDGDYGVPRPNTEMQWASRIKEALGRGGY